MIVTTLVTLNKDVFAAEDKVINQWDSLKASYFNGQTVLHQPNQIKVTSPEKAENASMVPVDIDIQLVDEDIDALFLFVDANPIPLAIELNNHYPSRLFKMQTRIRLDKSSEVRVIVNTTSGKFFMNSTSVRTTGGGCGGTVMYDETNLRSTAGQVKMKIADETLNDSLHAKSLTVHIKHPMRTGFERTFQGYYAKAWYIDEVKLNHQKNTFMTIKIGPSVSADPFFKLYNLNEKNQFFDETVSLQIKDNEGKVFSNIRANELIQN